MALSHAGSRSGPVHLSCLQYTVASWAHSISRLSQQDLYIWPDLNLFFFLPIICEAFVFTTKGGGGGNLFLQQLACFRNQPTSKFKVKWKRNYGVWEALLVAYNIYPLVFANRTSSLGQLMLSRLDHVPWFPSLVCSCLWSHDLVLSNGM